MEDPILDLAFIGRLFDFRAAVLPLQLIVRQDIANKSFFLPMTNEAVNRLYQESEGTFRPGFRTDL